MTEFDTRQLRTTLGSFATGVTVVTTLDGDGSPKAMTANSFSSVSLDPPLILWSIGKDATGFEAFTQCRNFAVHFLRQDQKELSSRFANREARTFDDLALEHGIGKVPLFGDYLARLQCESYECLPGGDHIIVIGKVLDIDLKGGDPLLFYSGQYRQLVDQD
ncbi:MAG: flavin reductase family protein [Porticoccaceae bacterium]